MTESQPLTFRANLTDRQAALLMSGRGDRLLIELEVFGLDAVVALVGMTKLTGKTFIVTVEETTPENWTKLDDETNQRAKGKVITVGHGGTRERGNQ